MRKAKTLAKLKKDLDAIFSRYIRLRNANELGEAICVTCGIVKHWKELQNGHFMSRRHQVTRWNEDNCQVQCYSCNVMQQGKQFEYSIWLDNKYGKGKADELLQKSKGTLKLDRYDVERMILEYKQEVEYHLDRIGENKS
jgi:hypothetical protein